MLNLPRFTVILSLVFLIFTPIFGQQILLVESEVRSVEPDRVILLGGTEYSVLRDEDGNYGPSLENYPELLGVGYIDLARLHIVQGNVIQIDVLRMLQ